MTKKLAKFNVANLIGAFGAALPQLRSLFHRLGYLRSGPTITGSVNTGLLEKADRLFRNDDAGIWIELLQNARRAGASLLEINIEESSPGSCLVTICDNGKGIDDFQALLTLGAFR